MIFLFRRFSEVSLFLFAEDAFALARERGAALMPPASFAS